MSGLWDCVLKKRKTFITNEVVKPRHDCGFERYTCDLDTPKRPANCKLYTQYYSVKPNNECRFYILSCSKKSHRIFGDFQCRFKLCVKNAPASLK